MNGFSCFNEIDIVLLTLATLSISTGLLAYVIQVLFGNGGEQRRRSMLIGLGAALVTFYGIGWIVA